MKAGTLEVIANEYLDMTVAEALKTPVRKLILQAEYAKGVVVDTDGDNDDSAYDWVMVPNSISSDPWPVRRSSELQELP